MGDTTVWLSPLGRPLHRTRKLARCNGCGHLLPPGSLVVPGSVWLPRWDLRRPELRGRFRLRFCLDCAPCLDCLGGVDGLDVARDRFSVRSGCARCARYPSCDKVGYQGRPPGEVSFSSLADSAVADGRAVARRRSSLSPDELAAVEAER